MSPNIDEVKTGGIAEYLPSELDSRVESCREVYELNRHRVYSWAFWMTDNELAAEELTVQSFGRALAGNDEPTADDIDSALIAELRDYMPLGTLSLNCPPCDRVLSVRRNTLRVELERAVMQLPSTEKLIFLMHDAEGYAHDRVARLLNLTEDDSRRAVHQARLRLRELLADC